MPASDAPAPLLDANGFPVTFVVDDLPAGQSEKEQFEFAFRIMAEHGARIGDYLIAAIHQVSGAQPADVSLVGRWIAMSELVEKIHGAPITLTYRYCDWLAAEDAPRRDN